MDSINIGPGNLLPQKTQKGDKDKALRKACKDFESVFTYEMLKSMRQTVQKCDLFHGGQGEEIYESLFDMELSKRMADSGRNGLAELLYGQLKHKVASLETGGENDQRTEVGAQAPEPEKKQFLKPRTPDSRL